MSSSSDEDLSKFSEATDTKLFNNSLFSEDKGDCSTNVPVKSSLRYLEAPDENRTDLKVTPGFQKHVASRLMKILDSSLDQDPVVPEQTSTPEHDSNGNCTSDLSSKKPEGGIRLFGASAAFLASCNITPPPTTRRRKRGRRAARISSASEDDSSCCEADISSLSLKDSPEKVKKLGVHDEKDLSDRFAACAVSPDWILNGEATKGWALSRKSKELIEGEATPDLIKMTAALAISSANNNQYRTKKKKRKKGSSATMAFEAVMERKRKRGKRGRQKKKIVFIEVVEDENLKDKAYVPGLKKKQPPREIIDGEEVMTEKEKRENLFSRALYRQFKNSISGHVSSKQLKYEQENPGQENPGQDKPGQVNGENGAEVNVVPKKRRKKKKRKKEKEDLDEMDLSLNYLLRQMKQKRRQERLAQLPTPVPEDEGFDSDTTKANKKRRKKRRLLRAKLKEKRKLEKTQWSNKIEYLSEDLANLIMAPVKED